MALNTKKVVLLISAIIAFLVISVASLFVWVAFYPTKNDFNGTRTVGLVFGAGISKNSEPSIALKQRLDKAIELYQESKIQLLMVSGTVEEVTVMQKYLVNCGIPKTSIVGDREGANTYETLNNYKRLAVQYGWNGGVVFISQRYHLPRISLIAERLGITNPELIAAQNRDIESDEHFNFVSREVLGMIKILIWGK